MRCDEQQKDKGGLTPSQEDCISRGGQCDRQCSGALPPESTGLDHWGCMVKYYQPVARKLGINPKDKPRIVMPEMVDKVCTVCGAEYEVIHYNAWKSKYCPECRLNRNKASTELVRARDRAAREAELAGKPLMQTKPCVRCGDSFEYKWSRFGPGPKYCDACKLALKRESSLRDYHRRKALAG